MHFGIYDALPVSNHENLSTWLTRSTVPPNEEIPKLTSFGYITKFQDF